MKREKPADKQIVSDRMQGVDCPYCEDGTEHTHRKPAEQQGEAAAVSELTSYIVWLFSGHPKAYQMSQPDRIIKLRERLDEFARARAATLPPQQLETPYDLTDRERHIQNVYCWLRDRAANCRRLAEQKTGSDKDGWLEDAQYFDDALSIIVTCAEAALPAQPQQPSRVSAESLFRVYFEEEPIAFSAIDYVTRESWQRLADHVNALAEATQTPAIPRCPICGIQGQCQHVITQAGIGATPAVDLPPAKYPKAADVTFAEGFKTPIVGAAVEPPAQDEDLAKKMRDGFDAQPTYAEVTSAMINGLQAALAAERKRSQELEGGVNLIITRAKQGGTNLGTVLKMLRALTPKVGQKDKV